MFDLPQAVLQDDLEVILSFDVCLAVHHSNNNIDNQLDATITVY